MNKFFVQNIKNILKSKNFCKYVGKKFVYDIIYIWEMASKNQKI